MFPFGAAAEGFHWFTLLSGGKVLRDSQMEDLFHGLPDLPATMDQFYSDWSNLTRHLHLPIKMLTARRWAGPARQGLPQELGDVVRCCEAVIQNETLRRELAWLEHRRRNAFLRAEGFRRPPRLVRALAAAEEGTHSALEDLVPLAYKNVSARLHPALVEGFRENREGQEDLLDRVSRLRREVDRLAGREGASDSLKDYDLPREEYGPRLDREAVQLLLGGQKVSRAILNTWEDPACPGWYFPGLVLDFLTESTGKSSPN